MKIMTDAPRSTGIVRNPRAREWVMSLGFVGHSGCRGLGWLHSGAMGDKGVEHALVWGLRKTNLGLGWNCFFPACQLLQCWNVLQRMLERIKVES